MVSLNDIFFYGLILVALVIVGAIILLAFTCGFKKSGRLMGGLFGVIGRPGEGKSFIVTHYCLKHMREGRRVFSNFPIVSVDGKYCSRVIEGLKEVRDKSGKVIEEKVIENIRYLMKQNLNRAVLALDEAHLFFWSRDFKKFSDEDKNFFTFLGQHEITVYYIVQHQDRMDTIANDCANLFAVVEKFEIPLINMPLFFMVTWWASEQDMIDAAYHPEIVPYLVERIWFNLDTANAYDTRFFGHDKRKPYEGISWIEFKAQQGVMWTPPKDVSLGRFLIMKIEKWIARVTAVKEREVKNITKNIEVKKETIIGVGFQVYMDSSLPLVPIVRYYVSFAYWTMRVWYVFTFTHSTFYRRISRRYK